MRIFRFLAAAVLAASAVAVHPDAASGQIQVRRSQYVPDTRDETQRAAFGAVQADMNALFDAQRAFLARHGRYAASLEELPALAVHAESRLAMMVGDGWYVVLGGDAAIGTAQHIVHQGEAVPDAALQAARTDERGAVLNPR